MPYEIEFSLEEEKNSWKALNLTVFFKFCFYHLPGVLLRRIPCFDKLWITLHLNNLVRCFEVIRRQVKFKLYCVSSLFSSQYGWQTFWRNHWADPFGLVTSLMSYLYWIAYTKIKHKYPSIYHPNLCGILATWIGLMMRASEFGCCHDQTNLYLVGNMSVWIQMW